LKAAIEDLLLSSTQNDEAHEVSDDFDEEGSEAGPEEIGPRPRNVTDKDWRLYRAFGKLFSCGKARMR
jgi:hypothetical protein